MRYKYITKIEIKFDKKKTFKRKSIKYLQNYIFQESVKLPIRKAQQTYNFATGQMDTLEVPGRHDVCFALRAPVVVEAMTAIVLADLASCR